MRKTVATRACTTLVCAALAAVWHPDLAAQDTEPEPAGPVAGESTNDGDIVTYPAAFFERYRPNSALDMLDQLPGFRLSRSGELRGYGTDVGNVLINGRRPSAKRVTVASILDRIPASQVERIELIRGPVRDIELLGEPEVANVILKSDVPAAVRWFATAYWNSDMSPSPWFSNVSVSDRWRNIDYNAALDMFRVAFSDRNDERIVDGAGDLVETRAEDGHDKEFEANFDLTASRQFGATLVTYSHQIGIQEGSEKFVSLREPLDDQPGSEVIDGRSDEFQYEVGLTAERRLRPALKGNFLVFYSQEDENADTRERSLDADGTETLEKLKDTHQVEKEGILRAEFEWTGRPAHTVRFNIEGTFNQVANSEDQTEDAGDGPVPVFVPGANTTIEEHRGDLLLKDIWAFGDFELDYGLGAEISRLTQTGDADVERNLTYLKPHAELSHTPDETRRTRFRHHDDVAFARDRSDRLQGACPNYLEMAWYAHRASNFVERPSRRLDAAFQIARQAASLDRTPLPFEQAKLAQGRKFGKARKARIFDKQTDQVETQQPGKVGGKAQCATVRLPLIESEHNSFEGDGRRAHFDCSARVPSDMNPRRISAKARKRSSTIRLTLPGG